MPSAPKRSKYPPKYPPRSADYYEAVDQFNQFLLAAGVNLEGQLPELDGKLRYAATKTHKRSEQKCWYVGHFNPGQPYGTCDFFNSEGEKSQWKYQYPERDRSRSYPSAPPRPAPTPAQLRQQQKKQRRHARQERIHQGLIAHNVRWLYAQAKPLTDKSHTYLINKHLARLHQLLPALRTYSGPMSLWGQLLKKHDPTASIKRGYNLLLVPAFLNDRLVNVQRITPNADKLWTKGAVKKGIQLTLGPALTDTGHVIVCEGMATGASLLRLTRNKIPIVVGFDVGNLKHVCQNLRDEHPDLRIYIAADNDLKTVLKQREAGLPEKNAGIEQAIALGYQVNAAVLIPPISVAEAKSGWSDWNDLEIQGIGTENCTALLRQQFSLWKKPLVGQGDTPPNTTAQMKCLGHALAAGALVLRAAQTTQADATLNHVIQDPVWSQYVRSVYQSLQTRSEPTPTPPVHVTQGGPSAQQIVSYLKNVHVLGNALTALRAHDPNSMPEVFKPAINTLANQVSNTHAAVFPRP